jgi:Lrp/AsnC family transcriptional regulator, leucine-responsive regulatory protein
MKSGLLDDVDLKILRYLSEEGRMSFAALARKVKLSTPAVHRRVRALEERGVITGYSARLDLTSLGGGLQALVAVETAGSLDEIVHELEALPEVEACWSTAGTSDLLLRVRTGGPVGMERLLVRLRELVGVDRTRTTILLDTRFDRAADPRSLGQPDG